MPTTTATETDAVLKAKLADYLGHLETAAKQGADFAATQVPDVIHQMVAYEMAKAIGMVIFCLVGLCLMPLFVRWLKTKPLDDKDGYAVVWGGLWVAFAVFIVATPFAMITNINTVLMCWLAPKYFVLQQILAMAKGG